MYEVSEVLNAAVVASGAIDSALANIEKGLDELVAAMPAFKILREAGGVPTRESSLSSGQPDVP